MSIPGPFLPAWIRWITSRTMPKRKKDGFGRNRGPAAEMVMAKDSDYADGLITEDAVYTIQRRARNDKPFFLAVGLLKPHSPYNAPKILGSLSRGRR